MAKLYFRYGAMNIASTNVKEQELVQSSFEASPKMQDSQEQDLVSPLSLKT